MLREGTDDLKAIRGNAPSPTVPLSSIHPIAIQRNHFRLIYRNLREIDGSGARDDSSQIDEAHQRKRKRPPMVSWAKYRCKVIPETSPTTTVKYGGHVTQAIAQCRNKLEDNSGLDEVVLP